MALIAYSRIWRIMMALIAYFAYLRIWRALIAYLAYYDKQQRPCRTSRIVRPYCQNRSFATM
eukprot:13063690-Heterocapsa_arctica.AAC.1